MIKEKVLVIGLGEIGSPLYELLKECDQFLVYGVDINADKMGEIAQESIPEKVDVMHICTRCGVQEEFINVVLSYVKQFKPTLLIVNSTVPPGTTRKIQARCGCLLAHSPVLGVHKDFEHMKRELKRWVKFVGGEDDESRKAACHHFELAGFEAKALRGCLETELAKLFETTYRAWMITCFQEMHRISRHFGADFDSVLDFLENVHRVRFDRPIMFPGVIGGHCLIPNTELLLESYDSSFLRLILESNEKRKEEIKDEDIRREVETIRQRVKTLEASG